ncbi:GNAT family N-acetyltransferase [Rubrobacter marinus]|uniref:GNAT family N-acetyltransferase n=2 Tax=Rubrobacter marinus TaxID=2653852 RepID=A0A6G8Q399_9ACTN|nr:GNAT family N-acetyltransferase [Rubrobacter marinus]
MTSDAEVAATYGVMHGLRPHLDEGEYLLRVRRMREDGYRLAAVVDGDAVVCVAGFRIVEFLAHGRFLYVDDLVTDEGARSTGGGKTMLDWLAAEARRAGCEKLQLDSGVQRFAAHKFYFREGMHITSYHFSKGL